MLSLGGLFLVRGITNLINKGSLIADRLDIELGEIAILAISNIAAEYIVKGKLESPPIISQDNIIDFETNVIDFSSD